jgi:hypothetical protein
MAVNMRLGMGGRNDRRTRHTRSSRQAMGSAKYLADGDPRTSAHGFGVTVHPEALAEPLRRAPRITVVDSTPGYRWTSFAT